MQQQDDGTKAYRQKSIWLTALLAAFLFWIGLGVGTNMSDVRFWVDGTKMTIALEWMFMLLYLLIARRLFDLKTIWTEYRLTADLALAWTALVLLSYLLSPYYDWRNPLALMRLVETYTHVLFFLFLWECFRRFDIDYQILFAALIASTLVVLLYFVYIHLAYPELKADDHVFSIRSKQLVLNTHLHRIGYQVETALLLMTAFLSMGKKRFLVGFVMMALMLFLFWLGGRAAMLGAGVALVVYLYLFRQKMKMLFLMVTILMVLLVSAGCLHLFDAGYFTHALHKTFQAGSFENMMTGRLEVWRLALDALQGHWILGTGSQSYFFYPNRHAEVLHAHNVILQFMGEWGVAGTLLALALLFRGVRYGAKMHKSLSAEARALHLSAALAMLGLCVTALFGGIFFLYQTELFFAFTMAVWIAPVHKTASCVEVAKP